MTADLIRCSPLDHRAAELAGLAELADLSATEVRFLTQLNLRLDADAPVAAAIGKVLGGPLPEVPNTAARFGEVDVLWLGPDEWLVLAPSDHDPALRQNLVDACAGADASVTEVSAQRTTIDLRGAAVRELLARGCSIDLHPSALPAGSCVQTLLAQTGVIIVVRDDLGTDYRLLVRASFADYLASWLVDACVELS